MKSVIPLHPRFRSPGGMFAVAPWGNPLVEETAYSPRGWTSLTAPTDERYCTFSAACTYFTGDP